MVLLPFPYLFKGTFVDCMCVYIEPRSFQGLVPSLLSPEISSSDANGILYGQASTRSLATRQKKR